MRILFTTGVVDIAQKREQAVKQQGTDLAAVYPHLASQWHPQKNLPLAPQDVSPGSHKMVWWICEKDHEWQAIVKSRTEGSGCPICSNRMVGEDNNLEATHPELVKQWHPTKNGNLTPEQVVPGSQRKVWWICDKGHEWQARIHSRAVAGYDCPYCTGRLVIPGENDLASAFPAIAGQWHPAKNGNLRPNQLRPYSNRKVWWLCPQGHTYQADVRARTTRNIGCPYCANRKVLVGFNDLAAVEPEVARQWHPELNGALTPEMVTVGSQKKVWWQCSQGHVWKAMVYSRAAGQKCGCPVCAGMVRKGK